MVRSTHEWCTYRNFMVDHREELILAINPTCVVLKLISNTDTTSKRACLRKSVYKTVSAFQEVKCESWSCFKNTSGVYFSLHLIGPSNWTVLTDFIIIVFLYRRTLINIVHIFGILGVWLHFGKTLDILNITYPRLRITSFTDSKGTTLPISSLK